MLRARQQPVACPATAYGIQEIGRTTDLLHVADPGGTTLRGRFQLVEQIGQGAMGTVWRGTDTQTSRAVAVKLLKTPSPSATSLFLREIEALAELRHPNIVGYVDHGLTESGEPYLAMEWLEGIDLQTYLETHTLSADEAVLLAGQALSALAAAHGRGMVHRDLKPANIFLVQGRIDQIRLVDFGIVKRVLDAPKAGARTAVGTPLYMSPEQARGLPDIDGRSDLFSLGSVLYEALSGTPAFYGETALAVLAKVCVDEPTPLRQRCSGVPSGLDSLIMRMLAKAPAQRPQDAEQVWQAMSTIGVVSTSEVVAFADSLSKDEQRVVVVLMAKFDRPRQSNADTSSRQPTALPKTLTQAIASMGAQMNHLVDGTLLVTWSGNGSATELASRSARCALALRRFQSDIATAISMGKTVVRQGLPFGKLVDETSSRLAKADPAEISVDEETAGLIARTFAVTNRNAKWLLVDDSYATPLPVTLSSSERIFVGRDADIESLSHAFVHAVDERQAKAIVYTAEAGVGKSRLSAEWLASLKTLGHRRYRLWRAQGDALSAASPLGFVRQLAMNALSIAPDTPGRARRELVAEFLSKASFTESSEAAIYLSELVGASPTAESEKTLRLARTDPRFMAEQLAFAFADALTAATESLPLVLLLDDLQWADAASVKLLNVAIRQASDRPFLVIGLARPELEQRHPHLWEEHHIERRTLLPLSKHDAARLIADLVPANSVQTVEWIAERADGNPFFIEEIARTLRRRGKTQIPDAVLGTVQARLDDLPSPARLILRAASIYGRQFERESLQSLLASDERAELDHWLAFLMKEEILAANPGDTYAFRHELTREATYQSLTDGDRVLGHRLAGRWLETQGKTAPSTLLEHFSRAFDNPKSCLLAEASAQQAYASGDLEGAIAFSERGRGFSPEPQQVGRLRLIEARSSRWLGRVQAGWTCAEQAMKTLPSGSADWFEAIECAAVGLGEGGDADKLLELSFEIPEVVPADNRALNARAVALAALAGGLLGTRFLQESEALVSEAESNNWDLLLPETRSRVLCVRGNMARRWGKLGPARRDFEAAIVEAAGAEILAADARLLLVALLLDVGMWQAASELLNQSLAFARRVRSPFFEGLSYANMGIVHLNQTGFDEAGASFTAAAKCFAGCGASWLELGLGLYQAHLAVLRADPVAGRPFVLPFLRDPQLAMPFRPYALALAAQIELLEGNPAEASQLADEGRRLMDDEGIPAEEGEMFLRLTLAQSLIQSGNHDRAHKALLDATAKIRSKATEMNDPDMEAAFMNIPTHRALFNLLANMLGPPTGDLRHLLAISSG